MNQWEHFSGNGRSDLHCHLSYLKCDCLAPDLSTSFILNELEDSGINNAFDHYHRMIDYVE